MNITADIFYAGVNDHITDLFEGQYPVPEGMAYNSYVIKDSRIAVMDSVDHRFTDEWLSNLSSILDGRKPDYLIVQHMEPDHSGSIRSFMEAYPEAVIVGNAKTFTMLGNFFPDMVPDEAHKCVVGNDGTLALGRHTLRFVMAPMVHWPEVMMTYDEADGVFFTADAFGKFGALDVEEDWACEARRYYFGIVGKYGAQVQAVLKKAAALDIRTICALHGPILSENLEYYLNLYNIWSSYGVETEGVMIAYTTVYGNTRKACELLSEALTEGGCERVILCDLAREDMAEAVEDAFRHGKLVLATTTYNGDMFPTMRTFIEALTERGYQNRTIGLIENGSWAPMAAKMMKAQFEKSKNITWLENSVKITSAVKEADRAAIRAMAAELLG